MPVYSLPGFYEPVNSLLHLDAAAVFVVLGWRLILRYRIGSVRMTLLSIFAFESVLAQRSAHNELTEFLSFSPS